MRQPIAIATLLLLAACGGQADRAEQAAGTETGAIGSGAGGATFQPGQWEITTEILRISAPDMPQGAAPPSMPPTTVRTCLSPAEAAQMNAGFLTGGGSAEGCNYENLRMAGGRIQGTIQCDVAEGSLRATIDGRFTPTSYEMTQQMETSGQGMTMQMEGRTTGRRVGDCPAG